MPARQYLLQALPIALQALNLYSEAQREGYVTGGAAGSLYIGRVGWLCYMGCGAGSHASYEWPFPSGPA